MIFCCKQRHKSSNLCWKLSTVFESHLIGPNWWFGVGDTLSADIVIWLAFHSGLFLFHSFYETEIFFPHHLWLSALHWLVRSDKFCQRNLKFTKCILNCVQIPVAYFLVFVGQCKILNNWLFLSIIINNWLFLSIAKDDFS